MSPPQAARRRRSFASRRHEQREVARQRSADAAAADDARVRLVRELEAARVSALEARLVMVAAEIAELIRNVERRTAAS